MTTADGLAVTAMTSDQIRDLVTAVLATPSPAWAAELTPSRWCLAELTDGRLTGIHHRDDGWLLSIDEYRDAGPTRLAVDGGDWWRLKTLRVFDPDGEYVIHGDDGRLTGTHLTDTAPAPPGATRPRDRALLITSGTAHLRGPGPGTQPGTRFAMITDPSHRSSVVPGPLTQHNGVLLTRLHMREYAHRDPNTGTVGFIAHRYVAIAPTMPTTDREGSPA